MINKIEFWKDINEDRMLNEGDEKV